MGPGFGLLTLASLLVVGCVAGSGTVATVGAVQWSVLPVASTIPDSLITLSPPSAVNPAVSADTAYGLCSNHVADCDPSSPTSVELAVLNDTGSQVVKPHTLVWAIRWVPVSCPNYGGAPAAATSSATAETPAATASPVCEKIAFVDAGSGAFIFTYTFTHP